MYLRNLSWVKLKEYIDEGRNPLVIPIGSVEGHGAHLPINTDALIAEFVADRLAERNGWISLPPITYTIAVLVRPGNVYRAGGLRRISALYNQALSTSSAYASVGRP